MVDADQAVNPKHFGSYPADILIRIGINPGHRNLDSNPGSPLVDILALAEFALFWVFLLFYDVVSKTELLTMAERFSQLIYQFSLKLFVHL